MNTIKVRLKMVPSIMAILLRNLKNQQYGWFILGVSEQKKKYPVGTAFKQGSATLLEKFKYEISKETTDGMTFLDIIELYPIYEGKAKRVLMFKIPAAVAGMPTEWKTRYYARNGESLVPLQQYKIDIIRGQERSDWTGMVVPGSSSDKRSLYSFMSLTGLPSISCITSPLRIPALCAGLPATTISARSPGIRLAPMTSGIRPKVNLKLA